MSDTPGYIPVEVRATFTPDGWPRLEAITWEGETLPVVDTGRRWEEDDGRYVLARVADGRVFEIGTNSARWWVRLASTSPGMV